MFLRFLPIFLFRLTFLSFHSALAYDKVLHTLEHQKSIPPKLLEAIAFVESGVWQGGKRSVWPWTINVNGKGYTFTTKAEAIQAVRNFQKKGYESIDVGMMQINLKHHPKAFENLDDAFDPHKNVAYAATFLCKLYLKHGSWHQAVRHYHSGNPRINYMYLQRVLKAWANVKTVDLFRYNQTYKVLSQSAQTDFDYVPETAHSMQAHLSTHSNKMIPITISFFPLKLVQADNTLRTMKIQSGAVKQSGKIFSVGGKKAVKASSTKKNKATQRVHVIPLNISSAHVMPLR